MAELQPGHYTQGACHTAQGDRQVLNSLLCSEGVDLAANALEVTTAGSGLGVNVAAGGGFVLGDSAATQGYYHVYNDATVVKTHAAADPTDDRIDLKPHVYDYGNCTPTAGVWHGRRGDNCWKWDLVFRPAADVVQL